MNMIGKAISHYRILEKLGEGGMGVVYKAEDTKLKRTVALKFLPPELTRDDKAKTRFIHEAQAASALQHHNICAIHEIDETPEGQLFISMDCYEGETLKEKIERGPLAVEEAIDLTIQVAEGLSEAHEVGIVHRDIKPGNILVTRKGVVKILDFGLAKLAGQTKMTRTGTTMGTVSYMSPEQAKGADVDARSDIFSLGAVLYEMLTGEVPFPGDHEAAVLYGIMHADPKPVTGLRGGVPSGLERIIDRCIAKIAAQRYETAAGLLADLRHLKREMSSGDATLRAGPSPKRVGRSRGRWWWWALPFTIVIVLVLYRLLNPTSEKPPASESLPVRPNWILVADFAGPKDDPNLALAVHELVVSSLTESRIVSPLSPSDLKRGLELAMKPDTTRIVGEVAKELAYRAAARVYVEGRVDRIASGYSVVLNCMNAETGAFEFSLRSTAERQDDLIPKLDMLGRELRGKLGERPASVASTRAAIDAMTPSFEAFTKYIEAGKLANMGEFTMSIQTAREALERDPDFASAWGSIGMGFLNLGQSDSARVAFKEVMRRPERLTERQLRFNQALFSSFLDWDLEKGLGEWGRLVNENPSAGGYNINRGVVLTALGRLEEAQQCFLQAKEASPFKPGFVVLNDIAMGYTVLGRYDEARKWIPMIPNPVTRERREVCLALALADWTSADRILAGGQLKSRSPEQADVVLASLDAARGAVRKAARRYESSLEQTKTDNDWAFGHCFRMMHIFEIAGIRDVTLNVSACTDTTVPGLVVDGFRAAFVNDTSSASLCLDAIRRKPAYLQRKYTTDIVLLDARIAAAKGEWEKVAERLEPLSRDGRMPAFSGRLPIRWLIAEAYEKTGRIERAAESYEGVLSPVKLSEPIELYEFPAYCSFAHYRLVHLYSQLGKEVESRRHYDAFRAVFTEPDPELAPMLEEARLAVTTSEKR